MNPTIKKESYIFASKTTRKPQLSQTPGPGAYLNDSSGVHKFIKNLPEGFGSTSVKSPQFLNTSIEAPYSVASYVENPGVGNYGESKYSKVKKIKLPGNHLFGNKPSKK